MATKKVEEKKEAKFTVKFDGSTTATLFKPSLPFIVDKVEEIVRALPKLADESEIDVIGEKPALWETYFPKSAPEPIAETTPLPVVETTDAIGEVSAAVVA